MGIRLTGLSTPVIGAEWEYIDKKNTVKETTPSLRIKSNHKIKVFISSQHGDNGKYDCVRSQLKKTIEETGLTQSGLWGDGYAEKRTDCGRWYRKIHRVL